MHFRSTLQGTREFWNKHQIELTNLITQIGSLTFFFMLSVIDTKWPNFHSVLYPNITSSFISNKQRIDNVIKNPHTTSLYLHQRFIIFCEEIIEKLMGATNYWYHSEW